MLASKQPSTLSPEHEIVTWQIGRVDVMGRGAPRWTLQEPTGVPGVLLSCSFSRLVGDLGSSLGDSR